MDRRPDAHGVELSGTSPAAIGAAVAIGVASGVLSAMAGVGGAIVTTPGIRAIGATPLAAVGSTVPAIVPSAIVGGVRYHREGLVDWRAVRTIVPPGLLAAVAGAALASAVDAGWLMVLTALLVLWSSRSLLAGARTPVPAGDRPAGDRPAGDRPAGPETAPPAGSTAALGVLGLVAGGLAGLLGVGGGIVLVPALSGPFRFEVRRAVATSLVAVALLSVASLTSHVAAGNVDWAYALPLAVGVVPGARLGSRLTLTWPERTTRLACGLVLAALGATYLLTELAALR